VVPPLQNVNKQIASGIRMCCAKPAGHQPPRPPALFARPPGKPSVAATKSQQADEEADGPVTNLPDRRLFSHDHPVNRVSPLLSPSRPMRRPRAGHQPPRPPALFARPPGKPSVAATESQQADEEADGPATNLPDRRHSSHDHPVNRVSPLLSTSRPRKSSRTRTRRLGPPPLRLHHARDPLARRERNRLAPSPLTPDSPLSRRPSKPEPKSASVALPVEQGPSLADTRPTVTFQSLPRRERPHSGDAALTMCSTPSAGAIAPAAELHP
jgi:hypothetical protein